MKRKFIRFVILYLVTIVAVSVTMFALPEKTYFWGCQFPQFDLQKIIVIDADSNDHYEQMMTIWCNADSTNQLDTIMYPIVYPSIIKGKPINDYAEDPWPWEKTYRPRPSDKPKKPKFTESFYMPLDPTNIVYTYELRADEPVVYYTQYLQGILSVGDGLTGNGIVISPNPASSDAIMNFFMKSDDYVKVEIVNQNGQTLGVIDNTFYNSGGPSGHKN